MSTAPAPADKPPNILYIHSHDTGRYVQPYGFAVPTPNIQLLADQGVLFREAFCAMPTCSGSRACLLTGQSGAGNGMLGLAHRGWQLKDYGHHLVHPLRAAGYRTTLVGEQHISVDPAVNVALALSGVLIVCWDAGTSVLMGDAMRAYGFTAFQPASVSLRIPAHALAESPCGFSTANQNRSVSSGWSVANT